MYKNAHAAPILLATAMFLTGCGGGGGSSGGGGNTEGLSPWPLSPAAVRTRTGGEMPNVRAEDVVPALDAIFDTAHTVLYSQPLLVGNSTSERLSLPTCTSTGCTVRVSGETIAVSASRLSSDFSRSDAQPISTYRNISLGQLRSRVYFGETADLYAYGGWLDHSAFGILVGQGITGSLTGSIISGGISFGYRSRSNPVGAGSATWRGVMVGRSIGSTGFPGNIIQGDADITIEDLENPNVDIAFTNIVDLTSGGTRTDLRWDDISLSFGRFETGSGVNRIEGSFYGYDHEEVGGVFERDSIHGAFGGGRI